MNRSRAVDAGVSAGVILAVGGLAAGWFGVERAVPTPRTPVTDQIYSVGSGPGGRVELRAPSGWDRVPTGRADVLRFVHPRGGVLTVRLTTGMKDFATAAPRRLRELDVGGVDAAFTGDLRGERFSGRSCVASVGDRRGECAVVADAELLVTVLTLRASDGPLADVPALVRTLRIA
ncbi:putative protein OS=Tsukamurella paurometabola (strain ATCC 8368 / DSM / CCUG 35730 /CIP 100753 / JCM 10117 / KCTC 9821 / NBRC 16120 / NCIMB 702349/ NCTC 13040) OX=521096 GN=Tpau_3276 PE=4 SV=1 [Tsukamurella paurometabola]|uniref:Uncharacterized protein n=1 Tax=Tsukamurella paurometabola (strain ATCC 8368 / DSM 20162 / CCUG 35730 / CIP 100753 / JCM 10117 / KCTC 9821 / NBRC 16120 / NCIMB 702349 / NCTC 13040) TaxID=521096 RepID=D5UVS9_TSUPD|nr:hypothetical protein [Tsukamurella paurometabola]ADG79861.1 hypothetical protein Tpau_3276 [Tsukamurella paurometabola DSM 20162]SUP37454.1 Uncharacterised protein [Tsukamurella paurometabola]